MYEKDWFGGLEGYGRETTSVTSDLCGDNVDVLT